MGPKVLIIDDDLDLCVGLTEILVDEGYQVQAAASAEQGLELLGNNGFAAVLVDIRLPGMDGIEFLKRLKGHPVKSKIFLVSGAPDAKKRVDAEGVAGVVSCIVGKPFDIPALLELIKSSIEP
ncbi:MAG: response regulator [Candidatus Omnitrophica bacterium]|nr:response regulator [Candidatus Omnitrophota bacterium]